jgi:hypothetical protein
VFFPQTKTPVSHPYKTTGKIRDVDLYTLIFKFIFIGHEKVEEITRCIQKIPDWPPGAKTANDTAVCH